ncbi:hypothetical protein RMATCC62417_17794 [Rhizopus microsporus]|nr:hypothetical protein RMATCC62417_17794 [Rhizopus microsporus]
MSNHNNPPKPPPIGNTISNSSNNNNNSNSWLSNILRPRASSVSVESCLNITNNDPSRPLDARPVLPLLSSSQSLVFRCKHLLSFSELCKSYRFTHLEDVFFTVQDILEPSNPREARHAVYEFILACIMGQYSELGMARVTFYSSLKHDFNWDDFADMYRVLYALSKGGRDISGFEKNISKLLIHWLDTSIEKYHKNTDATRPIPYLSDLLHLLTVTAKFNFALFEEHEVTFMIQATHKAFFASHHDEIVYAFYIGITQVTAATRLCINALLVCCYEMPLSVTKMLNEILQRMSQIISVSSVSVHILEFLSALARLPNLYANFTGDMYKPVFAIALNYLQHSRSQQTQSPMTSPLLSSGPNSALNSPISPTVDPGQGALKQYVLVMAYMVITIWFTSIPLRERRKHVPFIIQRLLGGNPRVIDEQTYTCIDMLSRFSFADVDLAPEKSIVSKILMGDHDDNRSSPSLKQQSQKTWSAGAKREYVTHWRERLRQILRIKERLAVKTNSASSTPNTTPNPNNYAESNKMHTVEAILDFTKYT